MLTFGRNTTINPHKGYYCIAQYCPDLSRLEAANIGVVLYCPSIQYLGVRISPDNNRVKRFFGPHCNFRFITVAKDGLAHRLQIDPPRTLASLKQFAATRANHLLLTTPRPMRVTHPNSQLDQLFEELVVNPGEYYE